MRISAGRGKSGRDNGSRVCCALLLAALLGSAPLGAANSEPRTRQIMSPERFNWYEENYGIFNKMRNNGWAEDDELAVRAHYSFKYSVYRLGARQWLQGRQSEVFISYTGEFDFYMLTRPSDPVINRTSNPALHFRVCKLCPEDDPQPPSWDTSFDIGIEHRSDGQVSDADTPQGATEAQAAYDARNRPYFDQISRGSNYVSLTAFTAAPLGIARAELRSRLKVYFSQNARITWGPLAASGTNIADYDRVNLMWRQQLPPIAGAPTRLETEWTIGDRGLKTDSLTVGLHVNVNGWLPLYVRLHVGPMNTLSNYTQRQDSIGIGLRFDG